MHILKHLLATQPDNEVNFKGTLELRSFSLFLGYLLYICIQNFILPSTNMRSSYLALALATFITWCGAQNTPSYDAFVSACQHNGINPDALNTNYRYAIYDYSPSRGGATDCIAGFHHVRLVVGAIVPVAGGKDFQGTSWDLVILANGQADWDVEPWRADQHISSTTGGWVPNRDPHTFAIASYGQVKSRYTDNFISNIGKSTFSRGFLMLLMTLTLSI